MPVYLDLNATLPSDVTVETSLGPKADRCAFWNRILPKIRKDKDSKAELLQKNEFQCGIGGPSSAIHEFDMQTQEEEDENYAGNSFWPKH